jgi:hypothetical protein
MPALFDWKTRIPAHAPLAQLPLGARWTVASPRSPRSFLLAQVVGFMK